MYRYTARGGQSHGNKHKKFGEDQACSSGDMLMDRQTHIDTDRHGHHNTWDWNEYSGCYIYDEYVSFRHTFSPCWTIILFIKVLQTLKSYCQYHSVE